MNKEKINSQVLTFVAAAIGLAAYAWNLGFNLGAFGVIFFKHIMTIWIFSITILALSLTLPDKFLLIRSPWGYLIMTFPTLWLLLRIIDEPQILGQTLDMLVHVVSIAVLLLSLPYLTQIFLSLTNPDIMKLNRKYIVTLVGSVLSIGLCGYFLGNHNYLFMTCENFIVSGQDTPANCVKERKE